MPLTRVGDRKGFAFIHFAYSESVDLALDQKIHKIKGKRVAVRKGLDQAEASEQTKNMQERKIFASGFPNYASEESVFVAISQFGKIVKILSPKGGIGKRGFCYIVMKDRSCFDLMNGEGGVYFDAFHYVHFSPACTKSALQEFTYDRREVQEVQSSDLSPKAQMMRYVRNSSVNNCNMDNYCHRISSLNTPIYSGPDRMHLDQSYCSGQVSQQSKICTENHFINIPAVHREDRQSAADQSMNNNFSKPSKAINKDLKEPASKKANMLSQEKTILQQAIQQRHSQYQLNEKYCSKQSLQNVAGFSSQFVTGDVMEIEIIQDISTIVLIKNQFKNQALRAVFEEQNTYSGSLQN